MERRGLEGEAASSLSLGADAAALPSAVRGGRSVFWLGGSTAILPTSLSDGEAACVKIQHRISMSGGLLGTCRRRKM
jgi:hypothetical protein